MEQQRFVRKNKAVFEAAQRQERKRTRRTVFYISLFLVVSIIFLVVCAVVFLKVKTININGNEKYTPEQIMEYIPINLEDNMYSFDAGDIESEILRQFPYIKEVDISRDLPTTIDVNIVEERAYYAADIAGDAYILSPQLKVLECKTNTDASSLGIATIELSNIRRCIVGSEVEFVSTRDLDALNTLYANFEANGIQNRIRSVDFGSRFDKTFNYDNRFKVYIGDTEDLLIKMRFLVAVLEELEPNSTGVINISNPREASVALS